MKERILNRNWNLVNNNRNINIHADVPGDITYQLYSEKIVKNPYYGMNYKDMRWIVEDNFIYYNEITFSDEELAQEELNVCFYGIDTFSEVYFNGKLIGKTENMFLLYRFSLKGLVKKGINILEVHMLSTLKKMEKFNCKNYFATFNLPRIFVRKAQCHFGWDWAPDLPGYGIWEKVTIESGNSFRIKNVRCFAHNDGNVSFHVETTDGDKNAKKEIKVLFATEPENCKAFIEEKVAVSGNKEFINILVDNVKLWWPNGYGKPYLYPYTIQLLSNNKVVDTYAGNCAFREIKLEQKPIVKNSMSFNFIINDTPVYIKGANWVPAECLTGTIKDEKYRELINLAKRANFNMLRVWGGGIYEKDMFYDICDKEGIMVWQDFMFACADIPEEDIDFMQNVLKEVHYQVYRLINHPSIVYWCGGNEKTGSYGKNVTHGDFFCDYVLHGIVKTIDPYRPYIRQSPYSLTDIGNDLLSGESHCNSCEESIEQGVKNYRKFVAEKKPSFVSECAIMGPSVKETLANIFPDDKLWPINEYWYDRFMDNPYANIVLTFADRQNKFATELYGESKNIDEFISKSSNVFAELLQAESDYARSRKFACGGFLSWMFNDIWPSGTWALIDYYLRPKQAYYRMKDCCSPLRATFVYESDRKIRLYLLCDGENSFSGKVEYGEKTVDGVEIWKIEQTMVVDKNSNTNIDEVKVTDIRNYLYAKVTDCCGKEIISYYSSDMWSTSPLKSDYKIEVTESTKNHAEIKVTANSFAKSVCVKLPDDENYIYSDNYIDVQANCSKIIKIDSKKDIDVSKITYCDFVKPEFRKVEPNA